MELIYLLYLIIGIALGVALRTMLYPSIMSSRVEEVSYSKFLSMVDSGEVELRKRKSVDADRFWSEIGKEERHG